MKLVVGYDAQTGSLSQLEASHFVIARSGIEKDTYRRVRHDVQKDDSRILHRQLPVIVLLIIMMRPLLIAFLLSILSLCQGFTPLSASTTTTRALQYSATALRAGGDGEKPFAVVVQAEIEPDRMAEFLELIQTNAQETRKEPGCIRFDVLRSQDSPNEFFFYELYNGPSAIDYHKVCTNNNSRFRRFVVVALFV